MTTENSSDDRGMEDGARPDVSALASAVISALSEKSDEAGLTIRASVVRKLVKATLRDGAFNAETLLADLTDSRLTADQIVDIYIPEAARELGVMWVEDVISFAKVTIATARLQGLLTHLAPPWSANLSEGEDGANTLMILQASDTHTLGPHLAAAQLRRMGAMVRILFGPDKSAVTDIMQDEHYDLVLFSCSRADMLASINQTVKWIRSRLNNPPPIALGGLVLGLTDRIKDKTGVDLVTSDVQVAFKLCDRKRLKTKSVAK